MEMSGSRQMLAHNTVADVAYVANHSVAILVIADYNEAFPNPTPTSNIPLQARRPSQTFGAVTWYEPAGFSNYNALQLKVEHRLSGGLYFFEFAHVEQGDWQQKQSLDTSNGNQTSPQDVRNMAAEKGVSNYDQTLANVTSIVYQIPFGREFGSSAPAVMDKPLGGSELTAAGGNITNNYFYAANAAFPADPSYPFGDAGRNSTRATPFNQLDLEVAKSFCSPREGMRLQFRGEFFNLFNHTNFAPANSDRNSSAFSTIRSTYPARQIQFALKFIF